MQTVNTIKLSDPQSRSIISEAKSIGVVAGFGSGKTHVAMIEVFDLLFTYPGIPQGYAAPTYQHIRDIWYPAVSQHCEENGLKYHINKQENIISVFGLGNIVCRSLSNPDKIVGFEVGDFAIDEMDILKKEQALNGWRKCKARCRKKYPKKRRSWDKDGKKVKKRNQMRCYTTPEGFKATYELFKNERTKLKNSELIQMSTYTNLHNLPDDYIDELKENYPPQLIEAYINGIFTNLTSGTVYYCFDRQLNNADRITKTPGDVLHVGMDFNVQNMSSIIHVIRGNYVVAVEEVVKCFDTPAMIKVLRERYKNHQIVVYPDASGDSRETVNASETDIKLLKQHFVVTVDDSNPRIRDRILAMNSMFCNAKGERRYLVNTVNCPTYTENLEQQAYDDNGMPNKDNRDHTNDAAGYFISKRYGIIKPDARAKRLII